MLSAAFGSGSRTPALAAGLGALVAVTAAPAHPDDPKVRDHQPVYQGPGYRRSTDGANPPMGFPSQNVQLLSWITVPEFGTGATGAADSWGYVSPSGREYAIICLSNATGFVDVTDPGAPVIVAAIAAPECLWHDVKVFEHPTQGAFAYVVSECGSGVQVIDISDIDNGVVTHVRNVTTGGQNTHNVALNPDSGFLYRTGGSGNGFLIYDLNTNPSNPPLVATWPDRYVHDAQIKTFTDGPYAGREIAFTFGGDNGGFQNTGLEILDLTDKSNIFTVSRTFYPNAGYSHQGWLSADGTILYLDDELDEQDFGIDTTTHVFDVSNIESPAQIATFSSGTPSIDHNLYRRGNLIFEANYRSGLRVFDVSNDPTNPEQIAFFDTYPPDDNANFNGLWSNYPFFPSGIVIGSDTEKGLFVLRIGVPLIAYEFPDGLPDLFDPRGQTIRVRIVELEKGGLVEGSEMLHYEAGEGVVDAPLVPVGGDLFEARFPSFDCPTDLSYYFSAEMSDGFTLYSPPGAPAETYTAIVATDIVVGFSDDMETDRGYTVVNENLSDGAWERGVPAGDGGRGDPARDFDGSGQAWLTGNRPGNSDVDGGPTRLTTPVLDLLELSNPIISYARWFTNDDRDQDRLDVEISNDDGASWTAVESVPDQGPGWVVHTFHVEDFLPPSATMRLRFSATDNPNDSVTEAAIDTIVVSSISCAVPCPEDLDGSGAVDFADVLAILSAWGNPGGPEDLDESGVVDFGDILAVLTAWGACP